jgi:hypothetical protein
MAAIPTWVPITAGTIFTAKALAFGTLTTAIVQVGTTGAIIIRAIMAEGAMVEEVMAALVTVVRVMEAAGINSCRKHLPGYSEGGLTLTNTGNCQI